MFGDHRNIGWNAETNRQKYVEEVGTNERVNSDQDTV